MPVLETAGGKLVSTSNRTTTRPAQPLGAYGSYGAGTVGLIGGATVSYAQLYRTQPWIATNVNKLFRQMARLPLKVYKHGGAGDREQVLDGPLVDLLKTPWERGSAFSLKQAIAFPTTLHGNSVLAKARQFRGGPVTSFVPLDWRFLVPRLDDRGGVIFWETWQTGKRLFLDLADVIHFAWAAPDGDLGVSPLQQLGTTIKLEDSVQRYSIASFENAVRPSGGLVVDKEGPKLRPEEKAEIREEIEQASGGIDNAFRMMILGNGMDWKPFSQTAKEAELIESRKLNREEVAAVYDIPPPLIGILEKATFSNITEQHKMLFTTILGPWLILIQETLQAQLIDTEPAFQGHFVEFDLNELLKGDPEKRIPALAKAVESGIYTINEVRRMENLPPSDHPHADVPLIAQNNLKPLGSEDGDEEGGEQDANASAVTTHISRARDRVLSRVGAGAENPFDQERFERELAADVGDQEVARTWATTIAEGVEQAGGDPAQIKQFFSALSA